MVISAMGFMHGKGEMLIHYCSICGAQYIKMEDAEECEAWHKKKVNGIRNNNKHSSKITNKINAETNPSNTNVIKYDVVIRRAHDLRTQELKLEAPNIREAAAQIREKFPHHSGFQIKPEENPSIKRVS